MSTLSTEQVETTCTFEDFVAAEAELQELKEKHNIVDKEKSSLWKKLGDKYVAYKESVKPVAISKKKYCLTALFLGWLGVHQFMTGKKVAGALYLLTSWTGISFAMSVLDIFHAAFLKVDENNCINI
ncbi:MAG: TM2 domain-containing protein [Agathobacter sp.]|nr:TM2 domain-containing protein [Agathobacter sp.]